MSQRNARVFGSSEQYGKFPASLEPQTTRELT